MEKRSAVNISQKQMGKRSAVNISPKKMEKRSEIGLGLGIQKRLIRKKKKQFLEAVKDYLISDSYMYAPLLISTTCEDRIHGKNPISQTEKQVSTLQIQRVLVK
ncbi:uncharacterized protein LOC18435377 isoform X2 [Amborella trichopoda]|uniref:uncharacterized protein LOC18435377 isoform X2 n=1 Tax=Amborella trichopoda TaxID=13333 RepID=UPI0005D31769|nr:uncharacterized protein LOC18435377 isoform X2 [Amborella trichopoda]|eukprot:XP_006845485.2 uncharacterized protein LOC18435377 isoform X2 [Amborella trichopoda]